MSGKVNSRLFEGSKTHRYNYGYLRGKGGGVYKVRKVVSASDERIFDQDEMVKRILLLKMREIIAERPIQHGEAQCDLLEETAS